MYCVKCGVKLADTEKSCPLCGTAVFHPDISRGEGEPLFPSKAYSRGKRNSYLWQIFMTFAIVLPMVIVFLCDWQIFNGITWSGYVIGALALGYIFIVLPSWFKKPNPVIFVPVSFAATAVYLLYISVHTNGGWFLSFAFPLVGGIGVLITALVTLLKYLKKGRLYVFGGFFMALGGFMLLIEFMANVTFKVSEFHGWSLYPLASLVLLGGFLTFIAIYRPAREIMERKFFF